MSPIGLCEFRFFNPTFGPVVPGRSAQPLSFGPVYSTVLGVQSNDPNRDTFSGARLRTLTNGHFEQFGTVLPHSATFGRIRVRSKQRFLAPNWKFGTSSFIEGLNSLSSSPVRSPRKSKGNGIGTNRSELTEISLFLLPTGTFPQVRTTIRE